MRHGHLLDLLDLLHALHLLDLLQLKLHLKLLLVLRQERRDWHWEVDGVGALYRNGRRRPPSNSSCRPGSRLIRNLTQLDVVDVVGKSGGAAPAIVGVLGDTKRHHRR